MSTSIKSTLYYSVLVLGIIIVNVMFWITFGIQYYQVTTEPIQLASCQIEVEVSGAFNQYTKCYLYQLPSKNYPAGIRNRHDCDNYFEDANGEIIECFIINNPYSPNKPYAYIDENDAKCHSWNFDAGCISLWIWCMLAIFTNLATILPYLIQRRTLANNQSKVDERDNIEDKEEKEEKENLV